ncbi:nucleotidyltransferase domain-containing protein [Rossellomorea sp. NS-SX7]|uniref:nucleotidyltransferase domain-containing protein n=1 Tax=Rossellomorea sp. NS-SX7 TaxID=3463856 RepID=UPI004059CB7D
MDRVLSELLKIEEQHDVKILYAVEGGSRAWGYESDSSDYDIRFIYVHPLRHYLSLLNKKDVIENKIFHRMEFVGWDLKKALSLLHKSNPSILEWLTKENVYVEHHAVGKIRNLTTKGFSPYRVLNHYVRMAKKNSIHVTGDTVNTVKSYLNVIRPFLSSLWLISYQTVPPNDIFIMLKTLHLNKAVKEDIETLLNVKMQGTGRIDHRRFKSLIEQINLELITIEEQVNIHFSETPCDMEEFNDVFLYILELIWNVKGLR